MERLIPLKVQCKGGMDITDNLFPERPGTGVFLQNFEANLHGGYRRINGHTKFSTTVVPGINRMLGSIVYDSGVIAVREVSGGTNMDFFYGTGAGWGTRINPANRPKTTGRIRYTRYRWTGIVERIVMVDGTNDAIRWDGTTWTDITAASAPADPSIVCEYKNHIFYAGYSANYGEITFSVPNNENDFTPASGAGAIVIGDKVTGMVSFRDQLIIFCENSIFSITGSNKDDFALKAISEGTGCINPDTIQEIGGDVFFLGRDGIRTLAGTERFDDFELGVVSRPISTLFNGIASFHLVTGTVKRKNQYRLFYVSAAATVASTRGVIGCLRELERLEWEWYETKGVKPATADSYHIANIEKNIFGGWDGYIYLFESGSTFDGTAIEAIYRTPPLDFDNPDIRKFLHRMTLYAEREGSADINVTLRYDHDSEVVLQPASYLFSGTGSGFVYGAGIYNTSTYGTTAEVLSKKPIEGSGFFVSIQFESHLTTDAPYSIEGFILEAQPGGKR